MHHSNPPFHKKMQALRAGLDAGMPTYLVNSLWQENSNEYDDVLRGLSGILVREKLSQEDLLNRHGIASTVAIDASFFDPLPAVVFPRNFRGEPAMTDFYFPDSRTWREAPDLFNARPLPFKKFSWGRSVASLRTAGYLLTGRHHAIYAACRARIPFAASLGNSHKVPGLFASAGVNIPLAAHPAEIHRIIPEIDHCREEFNRLFRWMESQDSSAAFPKPS